MLKNKILVAYHSSPFSRKLIQMAFDLSQLYQCELHAIYIKTRIVLTPVEIELLEKNEKFARSLGAEIIVVESDFIVDSLLFTCHQIQITHLVLGKSQNKYFSFFNSLENQLMRRSKGLDVTLVSPEVLPDSGESLFFHSKKYQLNKYLGSISNSVIIFTLLLIILLTVINLILNDWVDYRSLGMIYLMGIIFSALYSTKFSIVLGTLLSSLVWNYLFIPPRFTFHIYSKEDWIMEALFFVTAFVVGSLSQKLKFNELFLSKDGRRKAYLYQLVKEFSENKDKKKIIESTKRFIFNLTNSESEIYLFSSEEKSYCLESFGDQNIFNWVCAHKEEAGRLTSQYIHSNIWYKPLFNRNEIIGVALVNFKNAEEIDYDKKSYIESALNQMIVSIDRENLSLENSRNKIALESQKISNALLSSVSHELRTPLSSIKGFASTLVTNPQIHNQKFYEEVGSEIILGVERLDQVVQNLLDMSRVESGYFKIKDEIIDVAELLYAALLKVKKRFVERDVKVYQPVEQLFVRGDFILLQQVLENLLSNACLYSTGLIELKCFENNGLVIFEVVDNGLGLLDPTKVFEKFYRERPHIPGGTGLGLAICKSFIDLHKGFIEAENVQHGGSLFRVKLLKELLNE